jgi:hypothetical protein
MASVRVKRLQSHLVAGDGPTPKPFKLDVSTADLADLVSRLKATRFPDQLQDLKTGWEYGADLNYMKSLVEYWANDFDWKAREAEFNSMEQFTLPINGMTVHFVHRRSSNPNAKPLLLTHGWPGSVFEFHKILPLLTEPQQYGGTADQAFHVVCPSLPGYGFSSAPTKRGWGTVDTCKTFNMLMLALKYDKYFAQGGDWGAIITRSLGALFPENVQAM